MNKDGPREQDGRNHIRRKLIKEEEPRRRNLSQEE